MAGSERWYWDLNRKCAVPASARGKGDDTLGPYDSKAEAENWRSRVEQRNESWDEADEEWAHPERDD
jgi:hypothetical protein